MEAGEAVWVGSPVFLLQVVQLIALGFVMALARPWSETRLSDQLWGQGAGVGLSVLGWMLTSNIWKHSPSRAFSSATEESLDCKELCTYPRWPFAVAQSAHTCHGAHILKGCSSCLWGCSLRYERLNTTSSLETNTTPSLLSNVGKIPRHHTQHLWCECGRQWMTGNECGWE